MITEYGMYIQLDHYHHHPDEGSAFRLDHDPHPITGPTPAPIHRETEAEFSRSHVADLITDPDRLMIRQSDSPGRGSQIRLINSSSGSSVAKKRASYQPQKAVAKRRTRQNFSSSQTKALEQSFDLVTHYPDFNAMEELSKRLNLPVEKIQVWFQNRRAKFRRNTASNNPPSAPSSI